MISDVEDRANWRWLALLLLASLLLRLTLGWVYFGFLGGDAVEILEAGFARALGLTHEPWKIRNTLISDLLVAPPVWLAHRLGAESSRTLCWLATWPFALLSVANLWLLFHTVLAWGGQRRLALASAALFALHWLPISYGATTYPRQVALSCVLLATCLMAPGRRSPKWLLGAGILLALAFAFRYSEVVFFLTLATSLWFSELNKYRRLPNLLWLAAGFGAGAVLFVGIYDALVWERPFASLIAFADYTLVGKQSSSRVREQPFYWYFWRLFHWLSPTALPLVVVALRQRLAGWAWPMLMVPLLLLSLIHHKELRYLQGVVPFLSVLTAAGALWLWDRGWRKMVVALLTVFGLWSASQTRFLNKSSMAAVLTAEAVAAEDGVKVFAAPQIWAYGHRLVLGSRVEVLDLPYPPTAEALQEAARTADRIAIYQEDTRRDPALEAALSAADFCLMGRFSKGRSKGVMLFKPCEP